MFYPNSTAKIQTNPLPLGAGGGLQLMQKGVEEGDIDRFYQSNSPSMSLWKGVPPVSYLARNSSRE